MAKDTPGTPHRKVYAPAMQKVADAWAMRVRGADWATIARTVGYSSPQNAMRAVRRFAGKLPEPTAPELRSLWRERLEYLWPHAARDAELGRPGALRAAVAIADRASKLDGLDAPQRFEVTPDAAAFDALVDRLVAAQGGEVVEADDIVELTMIEPLSGGEGDEGVTPGRMTPSP